MADRSMGHENAEMAQALGVKFARVCVRNSPYLIYLSAGTAVEAVAAALHAAGARRMKAKAASMAAQPPELLVQPKRKKEVIVKDPSQHPVIA